MPKMTGRTSARSSATRDQASSPPKPSRQSQSPVGRRTRSGRSRSQSVDVEDNGSTALNKQRAGRRGARQTSVDSVGSTKSASNRASRSGNVTRAPITYPDLSTVAEDAEDDGEAEQSEDEDDTEIEKIGTHNQRAQSPGGMSQMSGTTAITSYSEGAIAKLPDASIMVEILPDLHRSSRDILDLLAPSDATEDAVTEILKNLQGPGSKLALRLKHREELFRPNKEKYGSDTYIRTSFVLRKLLGSDNPGDGSFRPDPVIFEANLATLVTEFLVMQKESQGTRSTLQGLCQIFPEAFVGKFDEDLQATQTNLQDDTFWLALGFHTQYAIAYLARTNEDGDALTPDQVLASLFYESLPDEIDPRTPFDEIIEHGTLKNILLAGQTYSPDQLGMIKDRLELIRHAFRQSSGALEAGDLVDFEELAETCSWLTFLTELVQWSRLRLIEIDDTIEQQGGSEAITRSLNELIKNNDSQTSVQYEQPRSATKKRELLPPANITQSNQSFLASGTVHLLQKMKKQTINIPSSSREGPNPQSSSSHPQVRSKQASSVPVPKTVRTQKSPEPTPHIADDFQPAVGDGNNDDVDEQPRPTAEYTAAWNENSKEKNKENHRPIAKPAVRRRLIDSQPGAERISNDWDLSQEGIAGPSVQKRARPELEESDDSEEQGFQDDQRFPDPTRRTVARPARQLSPVEDLPSSPKRQRTNHQEPSPRIESSNAAARRQERAEAARARREVTDDEDSDDGTPPPTATEISAAARTATARSRGIREAQKRKPWSDKDSRRLERGIAKYGCSWSSIFRMCKWDIERDQVALKDKARNLKVNYLKTGVPLPINFEHVPLGQKELRAVRNRIPDYEE